MINLDFFNTKLIALAIALIATVATTQAEAQNNRSLNPLLQSLRERFSGAATPADEQLLTGYTRKCHAVNTSTNIYNPRANEVISFLMAFRKTNGLIEAISDGISPSFNAKYFQQGNDLVGFENFTSSTPWIYLRRSNQGELLFEVVSNDIDYGPEPRAIANLNMKARIYIWCDPEPITTSRTVRVSELYSRFDTGAATSVTSLANSRWSCVSVDPKNEGSVSRLTLVSEPFDITFTGVYGRRNDRIRLIESGDEFSYSRRLGTVAWVDATVYGVKQQFRTSRGELIMSFPTSHPEFWICKRK